VSQHLLRGAGTVGAASDLRAAERARTASEHTLAQTVQQQVYLTVLAYWQLVEAREELSLFRANEAAAKKVVDDTTSLVSSEQRPRSDLRQLEGNLANRRRAVFEAENAERQALYALRLAMGLGAEGGARYAPTEAFPEPQVPAGDGGELVRRAEGARRDVRAAREQVEAADARRRGAEWNTMPALDLTFSVGYAGALDRDGVDAYFTAVGQNVPGPNGMATLSLELPLQNAAARGDRDRKRADYETARFAAEDIERRLPTEVAGALDELRLSAAALGQSTAAVSQFELALQDERDKLHEGLGTVIDAVLTQELLIQAQLGASQNRLRYALALARLRLATGALPSGESEAESAVRAVLSLGGSGGN
jgi:outer membrane protein